MTNTALPGGTVRLSGTGTSATADSLGRFVLALPAGAASPVLVEASREGYLSRGAMPVWLEGGGSAVMDLALTADYRLDGQINVTVKEGKENLSGLILSLQPFHPDDPAQLGVSGAVPFSFRNLRRPAPYTLKVKREGYKDLSRVVELSGARGPGIGPRLSHQPDPASLSPPTARRAGAWMPLWTAGAWTSIRTPPDST